MTVKERHLAYLKRRRIFLPMNCCGWIDGNTGYNFTGMPPKHIWAQRFLVWGTKFFYHVPLRLDWRYKLREFFVAKFLVLYGKFIPSRG